MNLINIPSFIEKVILGHYTLETLSNLSHHEMQPERWTNLLEYKKLREYSKFNTELQASTEQFTCKKCKSNKCTYYELQTRSADESTTIFITCLNCGKNWKM